MSQNVEVVKRAIDAYNRRDVDIFAELVTADFEWVPVMGRMVEGGSYRGRDGLETYFGAIPDAWEELRIVGDEFREATQPPARKRVTADELRDRESVACACHHPGMGWPSASSTHSFGGAPARPSLVR